MIDIHCHILPGADDGAADLEQSLEMARIAVASGIGTVVATPHVNSRFCLSLDAQLTDLQTRGFMPVLAHPERCPWFREDRSRLEELVEHGVLCQVTAGALEDPFVRDLRDAGLVHCAASDAHDTNGRPPALRPSALTIDAPAKLLAGELLSLDALESAPCA